MKTPRRYLYGKLLFLLLCLVGLCTTIAQEFEDDSPPSYRKYYKNEWSVRIDNNDDREADLLAAKYGFINKGRVSCEILNFMCVHDFSYMSFVVSDNS